MKTVSLKAAREQLEALVEQSQSEPIYLTRNGKRMAMLVGLHGRVDLGTVILDGRPEFWAMIEKVRRSTRPRVTLEQLKEKYKIGPAKKRRSGGKAQ